MHRGFKYHLIPFGSYDRTRLVLPAQQRTVEIENSLKQIRDLGGVWSSSDYWTDDADCSKRATLAGEKWRRTRENLMIAGVRAIEYLDETPDHRFVQRIAFAPSLGCTAAEYRDMSVGASSINVMKRHFKIAYWKLRQFRSASTQPDVDSSRFMHISVHKSAQPV